MTDEYAIIIRKHVKIRFTEPNLRRLRGRRNIEIRDLQRNVKIFHWKVLTERDIDTIIEKMIL